MRRLERILAELALLTQGDRHGNAEVISNIVQPKDKAGTEPDGDGRAQVRGVTRLVLRGVLADIRAGIQPDRVREGVRVACEAARAYGLRAEELLIIVKQSWRDATDAEFAAGHQPRASLASFEMKARHDEALSAVITMCIEEFYQWKASH